MLLSLEPVSCLRRKQPRAPAPPATVSIPEKKPSDPVQIAPPSVAIDTQPPVTPPVLETPPHLPPPPPGKTRARATRSPAKATPPAVEAEPVGPPAEPLRLGPLLSESEQRSYRSAINDLIGKAERNLARLQSRGGNAAQQQLIIQTRAFINQAREAQTRDLAAARSLAQRAEILSREAVRR